MVYATSYLFPQGDLEYGDLVAVVRREEPGGDWLSDLKARNRRLPEHKRIGGYLQWDDEFPRTASMKVKRGVLADEIRARAERGAIERVGA